MDEGTMVKGHTVQLLFVMCSHPEEATAKLVLAPDSGNFSHFISSVPLCLYL